MDTSVESGEQSTAISLSSKIVSEVAEFKDVDSLDIETPLYEVIDPDALEGLFASRPSSPVGKVEFAYAGCRVLVDNEDGVLVTDL